jgi:hypothetical protein
MKERNAAVCGYRDKGGDICITVVVDGVWTFTKA